MHDDTRQTYIEAMSLDVARLVLTGPDWWDRIETFAEAGYPTGDQPTATIDDSDPPPDITAIRAKAALTALDDDIRTAAQALRRISATLARYTPCAAYTPDTLEWCTSCTRNAGHNEPATINGLCAWCSAFRRTTGHEPPVEILRIRHVGGRITQQLIDRHQPKAIRPARGRVKR